MARRPAPAIFDSHLVAVAGPIAAGKTTLANELERILGWPIAYLSRSIANVATARGLEPTRAALQQLGAELIARDPGAFGRLVVADSGWTVGRGMIADGVRQVTIYEALALEVSPIPSILVYLDASFSVRAARAARRDGLSAAALRRIDEHPVEAEVPGLRTRADLVLLSDGAPSKLADQVIDHLASTG